ncbi:DUF3784 domain-containing protein [Bacillaceae bacterium W0354]
MSKGMIIFIIVMGWTMLIHGGITYLIVKKKEYSLISGFYNRPEEERNYLIENGFIDRMGNFLIQSFYLLVLTFLLVVFNIPYGIGIGIGVFILHFFIGIMYLTKYEVPHKRKKTRWLFGSIFIGTFIFIGVLFVYGYMDNEVTVTDDMLEISGMYGIEWSLEDIEEVQLLDELPEVEYKSNGFATSDLLKGKFRLEEPYGKGILFVRKGYKPYLYVSMGDEYIILNRGNETDTKDLYQSLLRKIR